MAKLENSTRTTYNLKGQMVGNGATNWEVDVSPSFPRTLLGFNIIPQSFIEWYEANNCVYYFNDFIPHTGPAECDNYWELMNNMTEGLDWYDLLRKADGTPLLLEEEERYKTVMVGDQEKTYKRGYTQAEYTPWLKGLADDRVILGDFLSDYANNATVREALHIPEFVQAW